MIKTKKERPDSPVHSTPSLLTSSLLSASPDISYKIVINHLLSQMNSQTTLKVLATLFYIFPNLSKVLPMI